MAVNPALLQLYTDGGVPRTFTARARETMSGGQFVFCSGTEDVVSSGVNSIANTDIQVALGGSGLTVNGIVLSSSTVGSNSYVSVLRTGDIIVTAAGIISGGQPVHCNGADAVVGAVGSQAHGWAGVCGRAITGATSGAYALVGFHF